MIRNPCKFVFVWLACAAPLAAATATAQQGSGSPAARFALPAGRAQAESETTRVDARVTGPQPAATSAATAESSTDARPTFDALGAEEGPTSSLAASDNHERTWILAVALAGLAASFAATAYLAWSRFQPSNAVVTAFMPHVLAKATGKPAEIVPTADKDIRPKRRAA